MCAQVIARELNILPDSIVFADDNPAERAIVRAQVPGVTVPELDAVENYIAAIDRGGYFEVTSFTADDLKRNEMYKNNAQRAAQQRRRARQRHGLGGKRADRRKKAQGAAALPAGQAPRGTGQVAAHAPYGQHAVFQRRLGAQRPQAIQRGQQVLAFRYAPQQAFALRQRRADHHAVGRAFGGGRRHPSPGDGGGNGHLHSAPSSFTLLKMSIASR